MRNYLKYIGFLIGAILTESAYAQKSLLFFPNGGESILYANVDSLSHDNNEKGRPVNKIHSNGRVYQITVDNLDSITIDHTQKYRNWQEIINYPTRREIEDYNKSSKSRSPYLCAWLDTNIEGNFSQFAIDFKADYLPSGTYCSLANFYLNYGSLKEEDCKISRDTQISGYAGFQRQQNGDVYNSILSLWNVYCEYSNGIEDQTNTQIDKIEYEKKQIDLDFQRLIDDVYTVLSHIVLNSSNIYNSAFIDICEQLYLISVFRQYEIAPIYLRYLEEMYQPKNKYFSEFRKLQEQEDSLKRIIKDFRY